MLGRDSFQPQAAECTADRVIFVESANDLGVQESFEEALRYASLFAKPSASGIWLVGTIGRPKGAVGARAGGDVAGRRRALTIVCVFRRLHSTQRGFGRRLAHEVPPNMRWQGAARHALHRRVIIIANPDPNDQRLREADEPGITVVLARAGLAGRERARIE